MNKRRAIGGLMIIVFSLMLMNGETVLIPFVPTDPPPIEGKRVLIVYESSNLSEYPASQLLIWQSASFREWLDGVTDKDENGNAENRIWDKDVDTSNVSDIWKQAMEVPREKLPWILVSNGRTGFSGPLPDDIDETKALIGKYLK